MIWCPEAIVRRLKHSTIIEDVNSSRSVDEFVYVVAGFHSITPSDIGVVVDDIVCGEVVFSQKERRIAYRDSRNTSSISKLRG
jgi:hypothetical protein